MIRQSGELASMRELLSKFELDRQGDVDAIWKSGWDLLERFGAANGGDGFLIEHASARARLDPGPNHSTVAIQQKAYPNCALHAIETRLGGYWR